MRSTDLSVVTFRFGGLDMLGIHLDANFYLEGVTEPRNLVVARRGLSVIIVALPSTVELTPSNVWPDADVVGAATKYLADKAEKEARRVSTTD